MSNAKTERLVNLTMALLATRRYMQKSEIFRKVSGYSGSQETKERMFERDKDDLRAMGIQIDVASQDPLFEDEPGYRIRPETYQLPLANFSAEELGIISTALGLWNSSAFEQEAEGVARRVKVSTPIEFESPAFSVSSLEIIEEGLLDISRALATRSSISFNYQKSSATKSEDRHINPLGVSTWKGSWYLVGEDLSRGDIRVFKLSRITSKIEISKKRDSYEIPADFNVKEYLIMFNREEIPIVARIKRDLAAPVRSRAKKVSSVDDEWDLVEYTAESSEEAIAEALWYADSLVVLSPEVVQRSVVSSLQKIAKSHE